MEKMIIDGVNISVVSEPSEIIQIYVSEAKKLLGEITADIENEIISLFVNLSRGFTFKDEIIYIPKCSNKYDFFEQILYHEIGHIINNDNANLQSMLLTNDPRIETYNGVKVCFEMEKRADQYAVSKCGKTPLSGNNDDHIAFIKESYMCMVEALMDKFKNNEILTNLVENFETLFNVDNEIKAIEYQRSRRLV